MMSTESRDHHRNGANVRDVMSTVVLAVTFKTDFRQIARIFRDYQVSACPVINDAGQVLGVVSEADLLHKAADTDFPAGLIRLEWKLSEQSKASAVTAGELMTSPAVTITADAPVTVAAKAMQDRRLKRLPVVDDDGKLIGIVSRVDVLSVYERPDSAIRADIQRIIETELALKPEAIGVTVNAGIVTLTGSMDRLETALHLVARIRHADGVIATRDRLTVSGQPRRLRRARPRSGQGTAGAVGPAAR
jgi:CBS domain-containing protein